MNKNITEWEEYGWNVIAAMFENKRYEQTVILNDIRPDDFQNKLQQDIARAAKKIYGGNGTLSPAALAVKVKDATVEELEDLANSFTDDRQARYAAKEVLKFSDAHRTHAAFGAYRKRIERGEDVSKVRSEAMGFLSSNSRGMNDPSMAAIAQRKQIKLAMGQAPVVISTGINWFDTTFMGGMRSGNLLVLDAMEKNRKTSIIRNIILYGLRELKGWDGSMPILKPRPDVAMAFLAMENDQDSTMYDFVAMLMYEYVYYNRLRSETVRVTLGPEDSPQTMDLTFEAACSALVIEDAHAYNRWIDFPPALIAAWDYAWEQVTSINLDIFDRREENGGLRTHRSVSDSLKIFSARHENKRKVAFIDYAQLVTTSGDIYKDLVDIAALSLDAAIQERMAIFNLSQVNNEFKKDKEQGTVGNRLGTKGGAALAEACHIYMTVEYNDERLQATLSLKRARRLQVNKTSYIRWNLHGPSGLITGSNNGPLFKKMVEF